MNAVEIYEKAVRSLERNKITLGEFEAQISVLKDVEPVVHGRWLDVQEAEMYVPDMKFTITKTDETCSECKARIGFVGAKQYLFDSVCPNCGADMRERSDGE